MLSRVASERTKTGKKIDALIHKITCIHQHQKVHHLLFTKLFLIDEVIKMRRMLSKGARCSCVAVPKLNSPP